MTFDEILEVAFQCGFHRLSETDGTRRFLVNFESAIRAHERDRCCRVVFAQCDSDNAAQRTVDAIRGEA